MKLNKIRIHNYKGFRDSGWLDLSPNFTVVVGKNNSGKSALLDAFRLQRAGSKPHRSIHSVRNGPSNPVSRIDIKALILWEEFLNNAHHVGNHIYIPMPEVTPITSENWSTYVDLNDISLELISQSSQPSLQAARWPSHGQFPDRPQNRYSAYLQYTPSTAQWAFQSVVGNEENLATIAHEIASRQIYYFSAERLNIDQSAPQANQILASNASNLPTVLQELSNVPNLWAKFNQHVSEIFPSITAITTPPIENNNHVTVRVWQIPLHSNRDDLAVRLTDCGTGIGQVLAILYVALTRRQNVIVIDEPNSFLHPGASRKLIEILKLYDTNQYILSTHSPELIGCINPDIIHRVQWDSEAGESQVDQISRSSIEDMSVLLDDLGTKLSDVFGADYIIWVEGQTEEVCFSAIAASGQETPPSGTIFVRVRATGDFDSKKADANFVWEVYDRLSTGVALVPPTLAFNFDREGRTEQEIADLERRSTGRVRFLPRCLLENYFLHPQAVASAISCEMKLRDVELDRPDAPSIDSIFAAIGHEFGERDSAFAWSEDQRWLISCHGAELLNAVFAKFHLTYHKVQHGQLITEWLLSHDRDHINELSTYVRSLWSRS